MTAPVQHPVSVADILDRAADLIEPEGAWTQRACARNKAGISVNWDGPDASCFCALGAIFRSAPPGTSGGDDFFGRHLGGSGWSAIPVFNDDEDRQQSEVVAALHSAATAARQQEQS